MTKAKKIEIYPSDMLLKISDKSDGKNPFNHNLSKGLI
jgi:hypothetical protein